jgi:hypothetical protein
MTRVLRIVLVEPFCDELRVVMVLGKNDRLSQTVSFSAETKAPLNRWLFNEDTVDKVLVQPTSR